MDRFSLQGVQELLFWSSTACAAITHACRMEGCRCTESGLYVFQAVKKRNRHLGAAVGSRAARPLRALDLLSAQHFYTSPRLAALATQGDILSQVRGRLPLLLAIGVGAGALT